MASNSKLIEMHLPSCVNFNFNEFSILLRNTLSKLYWIVVVVVVAASEALDNLRANVMLTIFSCEFHGCGFNVHTYQQQLRNAFIM